MLVCGILRDQREITTMKYVLALAVFAVVALPVVAMAGDAEQANVVAAGAVQLSDQELDNISAAGLGPTNNPGQLMRANRLLLQSQVPCAHGKSCYAPGKTFGASGFAHNLHK
jgi:hypothetical protein